ncbi:hypothetical protein F5Y16DRAFT_397052 [Xylariaceae sp. FL0255]|nr:hypothetical protein F5Y16DRAFT_397052 [Xylariaceae sp. FL0255]
MSFMVQTTFTPAVILSPANCVVVAPPPPPPPPAVFVQPAIPVVPVVPVAPVIPVFPAIPVFGPCVGPAPIAVPCPPNGFHVTRSNGCWFGGLLHTALGSVKIKQGNDH